MTRPYHRDCILPPAPRRGLNRHLARLKTLKTAKQPTPSKRWRDIEETAKDTVKPSSKQSSMRYEVRDTKDKILGEVTAENYVDAALVAARRYWQKSSARRESGWAGHPGEFAAFNLDEKATDHFWLRQL